MDSFDAINQRRSVKSFDPAEAMGYDSCPMIGFMIAVGMACDAGAISG